MNEADALDLVQHAIWTVLVASGPAVGIAMVVGILIALFRNRETVLADEVDLLKW